LINPLKSGKIPVSLWGYLLILTGCLLFADPSGTALSGSNDDLIVGEALYMAGDLTGASQRLMEAVKSNKSDHVQRALYLLGRISLLTGDFRQAKEYFERAVDIDPDKGSSWMALAGIGDALFTSGRYEEAIRRYRIAQNVAPMGEQRAIIEVKTALCDHALGREEDARIRMNNALSRIPLLSGWIGREEEFYHSMSMIGMGGPEREGERIFVLVGPVEGVVMLDRIIGPDIPVREIRRDSGVFLELGPLADPVEAMILSGKLTEDSTLPVEIVIR
jgi:tetratricopeptide (TPR) repeat protein